MSKPLTNSIPLPKSHVHRTESEIQFCDEQVAAECRDSLMFHRLVRGIEDIHYEVQRSLNYEIDTANRDSSSCHHACHAMIQNRQVIENIISTRVGENQNNNEFVPSGFLSTIHQHEDTIARPVSPVRNGENDDDWFIEGIQDDVFAQSSPIILDTDYSKTPSSIESIVSDDSITDDEGSIFDLEL